MKLSNARPLAHGKPEHKARWTAAITKQNTGLQYILPGISISIRSSINMTNIMSGRFSNIRMLSTSLTLLLTAKMVAEAKAVA